MRYIKILPITALVLLFGLAGCEKQGPLESAGEKTDEVMTDLGNKVEDACEDAKKGAGAKDTDC